MLEVRIDVQAHAMQAHPAPDADADAGDLRARDEDADLAGMTLALDAEMSEGRDQPVFEGGDEGPDVAAARWKGRASHRPRAGPGRDR